MRNLTTIPVDIYASGIHLDYLVDRVTSIVRAVGYDGGTDLYPVIDGTRIHVVMSDIDGREWIVCSISGKRFGGIRYVADLAAERLRYSSNMIS